MPLESRMITPYRFLAFAFINLKVQLVIDLDQPIIGCRNSKRLERLLIDVF